MKQQDTRIVVCGGGTGGHIYPLLSVIDEIKRIASDASLFYVGAKSTYGAEFVSRGVAVKTIGAVKLRRYFSLLNIIDIIRFPFVFLHALWHLFWIMPDAVFSKGGTSSLPVVCAAWLFRIPLVVHESDSLPGLSNSIAFRVAARIGLAFQKTRDLVSGSHVAVVGNPIRSFLLRSDEDIKKPQAQKLFGFSADLPLILILGGSQGSVRINQFLLDIAPELVENYQILHQTGADHFERFKRELLVTLKDLSPQKRDRYHVINFFSKDLKEALIASDCAVTRAGSGTLHELAYYHIPSLIIPLEESARSHQTYNAYEFAERFKDTFRVIEEGNLSDSIFFSQLEKLLKQKGTERAPLVEDTTARILASEIVSIARG